MARGNTQDVSSDVLHARLDLSFRLCAVGLTQTFSLSTGQNLKTPDATSSDRRESVPVVRPTAERLLHAFELMSAAFDPRPAERRKAV